MDWASNNAISFDTQKSEVIQFSTRHQETPVRIQVNGFNIESADQIRWLGVYLDPRLSFKHHVTTWCSKALKMENHLRHLNSVTRGAAPRALITVVEACIISVATYDADVSWPGMTRPTKKGTSIPQTTYLCNLIGKVIRLALRVALPVWKTTPNVVLHREGEIPPARILLEGSRLRLAARLKSLDSQHPLQNRASLCPNVGTLKYKLKKRTSKRPDILMTRVQRAFRQLSLAEDAVPLVAPFYMEDLGTKLQGVKVHKEWANTINSTDICAYSDGSSEGHGRSSWGFVLQRGGITFKRGRSFLHGGEVFDAELYRATAAFHAALSVRQTGEKIFILLDNQAAVGALKTGKSSSSLLVTRTFYEIAQRANAEVRWVPGHSNIKGNEETDAEASAALRTLPARNILPSYMTLASLRRLMHQRRQMLIDEWWSGVCPSRYRDLDLQMRRKKPPELSLPRQLLHHLIAARSGHGDFAAYHRRFKHSDANLEYDCGLETSPFHSIRCRIYATTTRKLRNGSILEDFTRLLLGHNCSKKFKEFARATGCFSDLPAN